MDNGNDGAIPAQYDQHIAVEVGAFSVSMVSMEITVRRRFAMAHLRAADHFAQQLGLHESQHQGCGWGPHVELSRWYASAAIIMSFSALEAAIDEAEDEMEIPAALADALEKSSTLEHAQAILSHRGAHPFDRGAKVFADADLLRALRNALVHPKVIYEGDGRREHTLTRRIVGARLPLSPFSPDRKTAFPLGCMSAGVAKWAADSARCFIREMRVRLGLPETQ